MFLHNCLFALFRWLHNITRNFLMQLSFLFFLQYTKEEELQLLNERKLWCNTWNLSLGKSRKRVSIDVNDEKFGGDAGCLEKYLKPSATLKNRIPRLSFDSFTTQQLSRGEWILERPFISFFWQWIFAGAISMAKKNFYFKSIFLELVEIIKIHSFDFFCEKTNSSYWDEGKVSKRKRLREWSVVMMKNKGESREMTKLFLVRTFSPVTSFLFNF